MSLHAALSLFLEEYPKAITRPFAGDTVAEFIRKDVPDALKKIIGENPRYVTHGSAGQGNWARAPWAAVYDRFITESAQDGYYIVYLVREDFSGVYLSLNQGVTSAKRGIRIRGKVSFKGAFCRLRGKIGASHSWSEY
jgi:5-methylcytosine-specific restriction enzyme A